MKTTLGFLLALACLVSVAQGAEQSSADAKWSDQVKKMMAAGPTSLSVSQESRLKVVQTLAQEQGRDCKVQRAGNTWRVEISGPKAIKKASLR
jgi:hypothetical protein